ncbi:glutamate-5-semialdehyde dehydrogenase [Shewanella submarina]|uniref:Gamma-glutamyl phosphate reductase n=1 Tax=Shewanella submarina TaxID=2016376 RepID=A0ABV7GJ37_9GAMM|nr:glutamate-5-semialdehyde dehydrogenase [Shewanella submarina]MCL1036117.1 glutamate-5-semialdehyde dehydrogenase [Shewanella submarina]
MSLIKEIALKASQAAKVLAGVSTDTKNQVLQAMANALEAQQQQIIEANRQDLSQADELGLSAAMVDRLTLTPARVADMAQGLRTLASLEDPVGKTRLQAERPNGLKVEKMRIPLGVVCMIYEARPNVTADAGALCFKSGNAVILRGGKEALASSLAISAILQQVLEQFNLPAALISVVPNPDRALMQELMEQQGLIDVIIPRGGEGLIRYVTENSKVPVIQHFKGVCHLYIDRDADINQALSLLVNGKTQRTGVCNALEGCLVHKDIAADFLPLAAEALKEKSVFINGCEQTAQHIQVGKVLKEEEFGQEYLDLEIAIRQVDNVDAALAHIDRFGSHHTEVICTTNEETAARFQRLVDASVVMWNASSRFSDGAELGLGAEIGIATTKLHAYGPMGLEALTAEKFVVTGSGQIKG